jgi:hypothetical protein
VLCKLIIYTSTYKKLRKKKKEKKKEKEKRNWWPYSLVTTYIPPNELVDISYIYIFTPLKCGKDVVGLDYEVEETSMVFREKQKTIYLQNLSHSLSGMWPMISGDSIALLKWKGLPKNIICKVLWKKKTSITIYEPEKVLPWGRHLIPNWWVSKLCCHCIQQKSDQVFSLNFLLLLEFKMTDLEGDGIKQY